MTLSRTFVAAAAVTLLIGVPPSDAQHRGGGGQSRGGNGGGQSHGGGGGQPAGSRGSAPRSGGGAPRAGAPRAYSSPRGGNVAPRNYSSRSYSYGASRGYAGGVRGGVVVGRGVPRAFAPRGYGHGPVRFYQPYYSFRPRLSLGFGLWVGFPIAYSYGYYDPYYPYPYGYSYGYSTPYPYPAYGYPYGSTSYPSYPSSVYPSAPYPSSAYPSASYPPSTYPRSAYPPPNAGVVGNEPVQDQSDTGGVSFEIAPATAEVFVDGSPVGTVGDFTPRTQPLGLTPGRHRIEIRAPGYQTMNFDADVITGQVIPYQGAMQR